jgi:hypothetical protein
MTLALLHVVDKFETTVLYRNGGEVEAKAERHGNVDPRLTTYGTFGPVLGAIKNALMLSRWFRVLRCCCRSE